MGEVIISVDEMTLDQLADNALFWREKLKERIDKELNFDFENYVRNHPNHVVREALDEVLSDAMQKMEILDFKHKCSKCDSKHFNSQSAYLCCRNHP